MSTTTPHARRGRARLIDNVIDAAGAEMTENECRALYAELASASAFLLPLAHASIEHEGWPMEVAAWLTMVRDSLNPAQGGEALQ